MNHEEKRLIESANGEINWKKWGPYLSERQWGTVREDYSSNGDAWNYFTFNDAKSKVYRWGEDGIGGICDDNQYLCLAFAFWNGKDPIIKERFFGLTGLQGNHGEDLKECYYFLDSTPTHSYMKMLYKYPQSEFPYEQLINENKKRTRQDPEFELIDTGIFNDDKYFDIFIEYAKADDNDILIRLTIFNRANEEASLNLISQIWFRNIWGWSKNDAAAILKKNKRNTIKISHNLLDNFNFFCDENPELIFCENETNNELLYNSENLTKFTKDGINNYIVNGNKDKINPDNFGTKAAANYKISIPTGASRILKFRLSTSNIKKPFENFDEIFMQRIDEADEFYENIQDQIKNKEVKKIQRQAFAGMLWNKQFYRYNITKWLEGDSKQPSPPPERKSGRNHQWFHLNNKEIISMPDTWEYPWYAAWDLAFHCITLSMIDAEFAKKQLVLITREWYMHPNGQLPAYEWNFSDVNPPVHAWAAWRVFKIDQKNNNRIGDTKFLESIFHKLLLNFTWWVNRKDQDNLNIFEGGFLGLDNIGVFDRSSLPEGGQLQQADATSWMAMFCLNMLRISLELAKSNKVYQDMATKFFEHFLYIAGAMANIGGKNINLWDDEDEFFYDVLRTKDNKQRQLKVRSMVGLIPLFAVEVLEPELIETCPEFSKRMEWFLRHRPDLANLVSRWYKQRKGERRLLSLLRGHRMKRLLYRMLDGSEFLSDYGIRALSKVYKDKPYVFHLDGNSFTVKYEPGESETGLFGGNSNWRGPIWFPGNFLIIESLQRFHHYYGDDFKVEYPTHSGKYFTLQEIANELSKRLLKIFLPDKNGKRPVFGDSKKLQTDPNFKDYILFYEYFHGDNGTGLGASHQTGWTGLIAKLVQPRRD
jgi:Mannosylglycerate hydrolase MGH1-like glycoside hydrolase domain